MGKKLGSNPVGRGRSVLLSLATFGALLVAAAACGGDDGASFETPQAPDPAGAETTVGLLPCAEDRHMVVFDILGLLTQENIEVLGPWAEGSGQPTPRAGTVDAANSYRQQGYELLYLTTIPTGLTINGMAIPDAVTQWLQQNGFPTDEASHLWVWDGTEGTSPWISITDELLRYAGEGVKIDYGYTENMDKAYAIATGGVTADNLFTLSYAPEQAEGTPLSAPTTLLPGDDFVAHLATIRALGPVCQVG